jgi:hypothetical protein
LLMDFRSQHSTGNEAALRTLSEPAAFSDSRRAWSSSLMISRKTPHFLLTSMHA